MIDEQTLERWTHRAMRAGPCVPDTGHWAPLCQPSPDGFIARRQEASIRSRLLMADEEELLDGFRRRPGSHPWIGEHVGKWLHAACWSASIDARSALREKISRVAAGLMACQAADGYLGTYDEAHRFGLEEGADWDVWVHKYAVIGLLAYHRLTGDPSAVRCCAAVAERLLADFGPGRRSLHSAGTHVGMAATSVLEPIVQLYRITGEARLLAFARHIVEAWSEPGGPDILRALQRGRGVDQVANGKAYEMLSNLVGLLELYRQTGEEPFLQAVRAAFADIVANRRLVTGGMSVAELFVEAGREPRSPEARIAETCVTVTWIQLCRELLSLTAEACFADEIERAALNHLLGAQAPAGDKWCYYTPLSGVKPYDGATTCCLSSGPRGLALLPWTAVSESGGTVFVHLFEAGCYRLASGPGGERRLEIMTGYPYDGSVLVRACGRRPRIETVALRIPAWASDWSLSRVDRGAPGGRRIAPVLEHGYVILADGLREGEAVLLDLSLEPRLRPGRRESAGRSWVEAGPLVYGLSARDAGESGEPGSAVLAAGDGARLELVPLPPQRAEIPRQKAVRAQGVGGGEGRGRRDLWLTDFAHTGTRGEVYEMALLGP